MARAPKASFDAEVASVTPVRDERHPLQDEHDAETARLEELRLNPANSWLVELSEARVASLADVIQE
ncbi:hypothetical protein HU230_0012510 [Bradyrhizobium quebecense]|uniref:Uncharacterized protein n=1 Tax=Bradyrhizobium quebecense TaxID=2748629 RepID=A0A973WTE6_9BRAD|nr:hypothetical protein [Bradyrhizobium quebecense]UGA46811.1 hypothetical protein HU230_0012510 [Bradyrhizobium quebecense]